MKALVHPADVSDKAGATAFFSPPREWKTTFPRMAKVWADAAYQGLKDWMKETLDWELEIVRRPSCRFWVPDGVEPPEAPSGFVVLPRRWVVERTFAWLGRNRRLSKDYEELPETEEAFIYAGMTRLMLKRLVEPV
jgi:transposase